MPNEVHLIPVGEVERKVLDHICQAISQELNRLCYIRGPMPLPKDAYNAHRDQWSADMILRHLPQDHAEKVLGVVNRDLFVPELNFVFGLANKPGPRAIIALPRLREEFYGRTADEGRYLERAAKEAIHELGHTFGLGHCSDPHCVMSFSNRLEDTDTKSMHFCAKCGKPA